MKNRRSEYAYLSRMGKKSNYVASLFCAPIRNKKYGDWGCYSSRSVMYNTSDYKQQKTPPIKSISVVSTQLDNYNRLSSSFQIHKVSKSNRKIQIRGWWCVDLDSLQGIWQINERKRASVAVEILCFLYNCMHNKIQWLSGFILWSATVYRKRNFLHFLRLFLSFTLTTHVHSIQPHQMSHAQPHTNIN